MQVHDVAGESTVCVRSYSSGESIVYRSSTVTEGATTFFVVNNESETLPQYRLVNDSDEIVHYQQHIPIKAVSTTAPNSTTPKKERKGDHRPSSSSNGAKGTTTGYWY